jgi:hypothetical protein
LVTSCLSSVHSSSPTASLNEEVHVGTFAVTVTAVDLGRPKVGYQIAQGVFVIVDSRVKNIGDAPRTADCQNQKLKDLAGKTYADRVNVGAGEDLINVKPGQQVQLSCAFDVPERHAAGRRRGPRLGIFQGRNHQGARKGVKASPSGLSES